MARDEAPHHAPAAFGLRDRFGNDDFDAALLQAVAGGFVDAGIGDDGMNLFEQGNAVQADAAELGGVGQHHDAARAFDHAVVQPCLALVVGGQAELQVQPVHAEE